MRGLTVERSIGVVLALGMLACVAFAAVDYLQIRRLELAAARSEHTNRVLSAIQELRGSNSAAAAAARAYLLTRDPAFREDYRAIATTWPDRIEALKALVADNPTQTVRARALGELFRERRRLMDETLATRDLQGLEAALLVGRDAARARIVAAIEAGSADMLSTERDLLARRTLAERGSRHVILVTESTCVAALCLTLLGSFFWIRKSLRQREAVTLALRRSEAHALQLFVQAPQAIFVGDRDGRFTDVNPAACALLGETRAGLIGTTLSDLIAASDVERLQRSREHLLQGGIENGEWMLRQASGRQVPVELNAKLLADGRLLAFAHDVSERRAAQERLRASLEEKEILLKEIHHRVKNNLAVVSSILFLESTYTDDSNVVRILQESQDRIRAMALVHESLYRAESLRSVDLAEYATALTGQLLGTYARAGGAVRMTRDTQHVCVDIARAVPCGLILNELITNALKHGFPDGRPGEIAVRLHVDAADRCLLEIRDDGVGIAPAVGTSPGSSLGLRLVRLLARQIDAEFVLEPLNPGTVARLTLNLLARAA